MNCDDVQQAVHPPQGTSASAWPNIAACMSTIQSEKAPAGNGDPLLELSSVMASRS
jgi:hypothetical protein